MEFDKNLFDSLTEEKLFDNDLLDDLYKKHPIDRERFKSLLKLKAKKLGCYDEFIETLKACDRYDQQLEQEHVEAKQRKAKQEKETTGIDVVADGKLILLESDRYWSDGECVRDNAKKDAIVCNHLIAPVALLEDISTGEQHVQLAFKDRGSWKTITTPRKTIAKDILSLSAFGIDATSENSKALSTYLIGIARENQNIIETKKVVKQFGWIHYNGETAFFPYDGDGYSFGGSEDFSDLLHSVRESGDFQTWVDYLRGVRQQPNSLPVRMALAVSFASVLLDVCKALPFFLHLWGVSETGKTVALMVAASVWGDPQIGRFSMSFNSTIVGLEKRSAFLNSLPVCIDELQIKNAQGIGDFDDLLYMLTEGSGRTRGTKDGGLQEETHWRNSFITTGEQPITSDLSGGGAVNRRLELECNEKICDDPRGLYEVISSNFGTAGRSFVNRLMQNNEARAQERQRQFYDALHQQVDCTDKQAVSASVILAADALATEWIFQDDAALTVDDMRAVLKRRCEVDANERNYARLLDLIEQHRGHFEFNLPHGVERWGWYKDNGDICFFVSVFKREMSGSDALLSWMKRNGKIACDSGRRTKKERMPSGDAINCIRLILANADDQEISEDDIL